MSSEPPGLADVGRVFFTQRPATAGTFAHDALLGIPTERFDASAAAGYLYIVFKGGGEHRVHFLVTNDAAAGVYAGAGRLGYDPRPWQFRAAAYEIPIAGRLGPGAYVLELTIDEQPAGSYPFMVR